MDPHLPRNTPGRTGKAQQKGREDPVCQRPLALVQQGVGEVVKGALTAVAPVAFAPRAIVVIALRIDSVALAPGTLEWTIFPSQRMEVGLTLFDVEELVDVREHWHG